MLLLVILFAVLIPENVEGVEDWLRTPEQEIAELRFAISIKTDDLTVEHAAASFQVASH